MPLLDKRSATRRVFVLFAALCVLFLLVAIATRPARAADFSGNVTLTSQYVFRGLGQTDEDPALQAGVKLAADSGWYASLWASNVDYGDAVGSDAEVDYIVGWSGDLGERLAADVNLTRYTYPGTRDGIELDYNELNATLTLDERWWLALGYSNDVFASDDDGTYVQVGGKFPVTEAFRFEAYVADYLLGDAFADDYQHAALSAVYAWKRAEFRVTGHWVSDGARRMFGEAGDSRVEAAVAVSF